MQNLSLASTVVLLLIATALALVPVETLTGVRREPVVAAPDELPPLATGDVAPFLAERDEIARIVVAEPTTLRNFLDRNRLNRPWTRDQITGQLGHANPAAVIPAGTVFRLRLTPTATDVPGAKVTP
ncbi:MAG TPA: hypothetical protein VGF48_01920 [Thermoanaerobaculia bacterium]|jgi:hypothetical protein